MKLKQFLFSLFIIGTVFIVTYSCQNDLKLDKVSLSNQHIDPIDSNSISLKWIDYRMGEPPPLDYYFAFDSVIKKWGIRYERIQGGCEPEAWNGERAEYEKGNPNYFAYLERKFGVDWRERFDAEVSELAKELKAKYK